MKSNHKLIARLRNIATSDEIEHSKDGVCLTELIEDALEYILELEKVTDKPAGDRES